MSTAVVLSERSRALLGLARVKFCRRAGTDKRAVLLETLDCWFRLGGSAADVGEELRCQRNTVLYRLARIEELSGRSLRDHRDQLLGLTCRRTGSCAYREKRSLGAEQASFIPSA